MNLWPKTLFRRAADSANPVVSTMVRMFPGYGENKSRVNAFQRDHAANSFASWVYIAAMLNANAFAGVPLRLYVRKRQGRNRTFKSRPVPVRRLRYLHGERGGLKEHPSKIVLQKIAEFGDGFEEVTTPHPALKLLSQVNPWQNGFELSTLRLLYLQITGNAYIYPVIDERLGMPVELWPLATQWTSVIPDADGLIGGYEYGRKPNSVSFDASEIMRWALPSLTNPYYGMGKTEGVWDAIGLSRSRAISDRALLDNMGRPDWMMLAKSGATTEELDRLEAQVEGKLRGHHNRGRFLVASGEVQAIKLNFTPEELGDQNRVIEEIAAGFGVPITKLLANDPNRASAETGDAAWMRDTILPYCRMDEETLNAAYLPLFGIEEEAVLAYDNPVPVKEKEETDRLVALVKGQIYVPNDARAELGMPPVEGGDVLVSGGGSAATDTTSGIFQHLAVMQAELRKSSALSNALLGQVLTKALPTQEAESDANDADEANEPAENEAGPDKDLIAAAAGLVRLVIAGKIPRDSAVGILVHLFNLTEAQANDVLGSAEAQQQVAESATATDDAAAGKAADVAAKKTVINGTADGLARPLPSGEALIPLLQHVFAAQRDAVLKRLGTKGLEAIEADYRAEVRAIDPNALAEDADATAIHAFRRATLARVVKDKRRPTASDTPPTPPPPPLPTSFLPLQKWTKQLAEACQPVVEALIKDQGKRLLTTIGASDEVFAVFERNIPKAAQAATLKFCEATNATTSMELDTALAELRDEISAGLVQGDTYAELRKRVSEVFDQAEQFRAERIARTEASRAAHTGEVIGAKASGVVSRKSWLASADACDFCLSLAARGAIPLDESFAEVGGAYGSISTPPGHPNCTCSLTFETNDTQEPDHGNS